MKNKITFPLFVLVTLLSLVLAACQGAAPTPEIHNVPTVVEQQVEKEEPMEEEVSAGQMVSLAEDADLGSFLVDESGMSLYMFMNDAPGTSNCYDQCATNWPPLLTEGKPVAGEGIDATLMGTTEREDGSLQVTYNGWPLYYWVKDAQVGDVTGQGVGDVWFVVAPDGEIVIPAAVVPTVMVADQEIVDGSVTIVEIVSDGAGWLVVHAQVDGKPGPILGYAPVADGVNNDVVIEIDDENASETLYAMLHTDGGEVGAFEFPDGPDGPVMVEEKVVTPPFKVLAKEMSDAGGDVAIFLSASDELGLFLVDADGMTLYIFAKDEPGVSNCYDQCAVNWPPLLLENGQTAMGSDELTAEFGTTERTDGTIQVTYNEWPLYYWINDAAAGDTTGHAVGGVWAVAGVEPTVFSIVPGESEVSYEVGETFLGDNRFATAIGVTPEVTGLIMGDLTDPRSVVLGPVEVDISQFKSDSDRRDNKIRSDFLESTKFPIATFKPTEIEGIPDEYTEGEPVTLFVTGDLTIKETTQPVTFEVTAQLEDSTLTGEAATTILMSDFGVGPISILGFLETEDEVILTFNFVARP
jgi:predicted lipoprotein with Yx(FWY)xxD motif